MFPKPRRQATEAAREERRKRLLERRKNNEGSDDEDEDGVIVAKDKVQELKVVAAENDPDAAAGEGAGAAGAGDDADVSMRNPHMSKTESAVGFLARQMSDTGGVRKPKRSQETPASKVLASVKGARENGRKLRMQLVESIGDKTLMPGAQEAKGAAFEDEVEADTSAGAAMGTFKVLTAAAKMKRKLEKKRQEAAADNYTLKKEADHTLDKYGGTDVLGWNRSPMHFVKWTHVVLYIVRAHGDCSDEVEIIYSKVLPRVRDALLPAAVAVHLRDLGSLDVETFTTAVPPEEERKKLAPISHGISCIRQANAMRIVLLGHDYGPSWKATAGDPDPGAENPPGLEGQLGEEVSELEVLASEACKDPELKHKVFKKRSAVPRTLLYSCVDPDAEGGREAGGGGSSVGSPTQKSPLVRSPTRSPRSKRGGGGSVAAISRSKASTSNRVSRTAASGTGGGGGGGKGGGTLQSTNPIVVAKMQKKEEKRRKKALIAKLNKLVFAALVKDPETGKPRDAREIFKLLDEDGSGSVTKEEFNAGLLACGLTLEAESLEVLWGSLDEDGGGDLDYEELCLKLEEQYKKVMKAEARNLKHMPRLLASKLELGMPDRTVRARLDVMTDFQDTVERQEQRWQRRFEHDLSEDLKRLLPILALAALEVEEGGAKLLETDHDMLPLNFQPEAPEYTAHTEEIIRLSRQAGQQNLAAPSDSEDKFWNTEDCFRCQMGLLDYAKGVVSWPCILVGGRGSGRSHIIREFVAALRRDRPMDHMIVHTVGDSPESCELHSMLWHICLELGKRFDLLDEVMAIDPFTLVEYFHGLLLKLIFDSGVMLHIIIDGFDRVTQNGKLLGGSIDWFPGVVPAQLRMILTTCEGASLNAVRRKKARFDGLSEVVELRVPMHGEEHHHWDGDGALSSDSSSDGGGHDEHSDGGSSRDNLDGGRDQQGQSDRAAVHVLVQSRWFDEIEDGVREESGVSSLVEDLVSIAEHLVGHQAVRRFFFIVFNSRQGVLDQDLYEMLNANPGDDSVQLPFLRVSFQQYRMLREMMEPIVKSINFGGEVMVWFAQAAYFECVQTLFDFKTYYTDVHALMAQHYSQQVAFLSDPSLRWHGEHRRAITELVYHLSQAASSERVLKMMTNLRYIEARCSLGFHQATGLLLDYTLTLTRSNCAMAWIKTDLIKVQDCFTMVRRYAQTFFKHPRWVFSVSASLPDTSGPAVIAKASWSLGEEVRPQLAWLNKPQVVSPCILKLDEMKIVLHTACFSRDMTRMVAGGQDNMLFVWSLPEGNLIAKMPGHTDHIMSIQISVDDEHIISGGRDGNVIFWKMPGMEELEERVRAAEEALRVEAERRALEEEEETESEEEGEEEERSARPSSGDGSERGSNIGDGNDDHEGSNGGVSRPISRQKSVTIVGARKKGKGSKRPPMEMPDVHLDTSKVLSIIPAHKSTVWSVSFSTVFKYRTTIQIPVGEKRHLGEVVPIYGDFDGFYARLSSKANMTIAFPLSVKASVLITRSFSEDEKKIMRLRAKANKDAKIAEEKAAAAAAAALAEETEVSVERDNAPPTKARRSSTVGRRASIMNELENWAAETSLEVKSAIDEQESLLAELMDPKSVPNYEFQQNMKGKMVAFSLVNGDGNSLEEREILQALRTFQGCGATAVLLGCAEDDAQEIIMEATGFEIPVVTVGKHVFSELKDDTQVKIYRRLEHGNLCASASSDRTVKIWDSSRGLSGHALARRPVAILEGHSSYVTHCSFSPYGETLASSGGDNTVRMWDTTTMKEKFVYTEAFAAVMESVWSNDGTMMLSVSHDGWFRLWRTSDGHTLKASKGPHKGHLWSCAFSEDQKFVATGGHDGRVVIWDVEQMLTRNKEAMVFDGHLGPIFSLHFSPDATRIVSCSSDRTARVWATDHDLEHYSLHHEQQNLEKKQAEQAHKLEMKELIAKSRSGWSNIGGAKTVWEKAGHPTTIHCIAFSPDNRDMVTGGADAEIIVWSTSSENLRKKLLGHTAAVFVLAYSREGTYLASGDSGGEILIWDAIGGRKLFSFASHTDRVWSLHFNPKSTRLISSSSDCTIKLWRLDDPFADMDKKSGLVLYDEYYEDNQSEVMPGIPQLILPTGSSAAGSSKKMLETSGGGLAMLPGKQKKKSENGTQFKAYDEKRSAIMQTIILKRIVYCCKFSSAGQEIAAASADSLVHLYKFADEDMEELEEYGTMPRQGMDAPEKHRSYVKHVSKLCLDAFSKFDLVLPFGR